MKFKNVLLMTGILVALGKVSLATGMTTADFNSNFSDEIKNEKMLKDVGAEINKINEKENTKKIMAAITVKDVIKNKEVENYLNYSKFKEKENEMGKKLLDGEEILKKEYADHFEKVGLLDKFCNLIDEKKLSASDILKTTSEDIKAIKETDENKASLKAINDLLKELEPLAKEYDELNKKFVGENLKDPRENQSFKEALETLGLTSSFNDNNSLEKLGEFEKVLDKKLEELKELKDNPKLVDELEAISNKFKELNKEKENYEIKSLAAKINPNGIVDKLINLESVNPNTNAINEKALDKYSELADAYVTYEQKGDLVNARILENRLDINENTARINNLETRVNDLDKKVDGVKKGISQVAAMTAIDFQDLGIGEVGIGAAVGTHDSTQSVAVGLGYAATANFKLNAKVSMTLGKGGKYTGAIGATYKFQTR